MKSSGNDSKSLFPIYFPIEDDEGVTETREIETDELEQGISYSMEPPSKSHDLGEYAENMGLRPWAHVRNPRNQKTRRNKKTAFALPEVITVNEDDDKDEELQRAIQLSKAQAEKDDEELQITVDDEELQRAIQLSKAQAKKDDEELQKALLFSMESIPAISDLDEDWTSFGDMRSDLEDCISFDGTRYDMTDLKMKGVCHPLETNPRIELSNQNYHMGEASTSVCVVCTDEQPTGKMSRLSLCGHFFCKDCTGDYLGRAIQDNIHELRCPETKCNAIFNANQCFAHLPTEVAERWSKAKEEADALKNLADSWPFLFTRKRMIFNRRANASRSNWYCRHANPTMVKFKNG